MSSSFVLPVTGLSAGFRGSAGFSKPAGPPSATIPAAFTEQKHDPNKSEEEKEQDEMNQSYIPLSLARSKMAALSGELASMKAKHLELIDQVTQKYELMTNESRAHFEGVVDEVKARASLKLKENKAMLEELREELVTVQEAQANKNQQYRTELKAATKEQGRLQQELLDREAEIKTLREQHEADVAGIEARRVELDGMLQSHVPREDLDAIRVERDQLLESSSASTQEYSTKLSALEADASEKAEKLAALEADLAQLRQQEEAATQQLAQTKSELDAARTELEESRAAATAASASLAELTTSGEAQAADRERLSQEAQERLAESEAKVASLESQLAVALASGGGGDGSGDGPARVMLVPDPELQTKVRSLETELNKLAKENVLLCKVITDREEAIIGSNDRLASAKADASASQVVGGVGVASTESEDGEPGQEESEYEDVETDEEYDETVSVPVTTPVASSAAAPVDPHASKRVELSTRLAANEAETNRLLGLVADLEKDIKPKVLDYKTRLAGFKSDSERKELESTLGYDRLTEEDGTEHELRPSDIRELEDMLEWTTAQADRKPQLAAKVAVLKENKKTLESNKTRLADLKSQITDMKANGAGEADISTKEQEFLALRTQMQSDATELKTSYAEYETEVKEFKDKEGTVQKLYVKFKIDPSHEEDKPRKLSPEQRAQVERLVGLIKNKGIERDALKALADEVNTQNGRLKELRADRDAAQAKLTEVKSEVDALPPPPSASETNGEETTTTMQTITRKATRRVTKRVKKPTKQKAKKATPVSSNGTTPLVPASLLAQLQPIDLKGKPGQYAGREFVPVTPAVFKAGPTPAAGSYSGGGDPALQSKYDSLAKKLRTAESDLQSLQSTSDAQSEEIAAKSREIADLKQQLRTMLEGDVDERIAALAAQLESHRAEVGAAASNHAAKMSELHAKVRDAQADTGRVQDELAKVKADLRTAQDRLRNGGGGGGGGASSGGVGVAGGVDPSIVADLEAQRSTLEQRVAELEAELASHSGSLDEQLARKEAELVAIHTAKVNELETQLQENTEKLRITKKKAKELHDSLQAETATRQGLESTVAEREATIASMEAVTNEARNSMDRLKGEIASRDRTIDEKQKVIDELEAKKASLESDIAFLETRNFEEVKRRKEFQAKYEDAKGKVRVYARVRPFSKHEIAAEEKTLLRPGTNEWTLCINETSKNYQGIVSDNWRPIEFDHVFHFGLDNTKPNASQAEVFEETKIFAELTVQGINCCVFAYGQSGTGKCWGRGTELLLHSGSVKRVEDIVAGDRLMGDDGTVRIVQPGSIHRGNTAHDGPNAGTYRITQADKARMAWTCNGEHILVLQFDSTPSSVFLDDSSMPAAPMWMFHTLRAHGNRLAWTTAGTCFATREEAEWARQQLATTAKPFIWECTVDEYLAMPCELRSKAAMYQPRLVEFDPPSVSLAMRLSQLMQEAISSADLSQVSWSLGVWLAGLGHMEIHPQLLAAYGIGQQPNEAIPIDLLRESPTIRMDVLAGLVDACATYSSSLHTYSFTLADRVQVDSLVRLARSLGFTTMPIEVDPHTRACRLSITGELHTIPTRQAHMRAPLAHAAERDAKSSLGRSFTIDRIGHADYYGFTVTGNGRLLLGDFLVTHNTFTMAGIRPKEENGFTKDLLGLKPRMIDRVYQMKKEMRKTHEIELSCYMLEIYLNKLEDVFWKLQTQQKYAGKEKSKWPEPPELKVRVDAKRKVTIDNSIICKFDTAEEMQKFCDDAEMTRRVRKTGLNEESSRSHLIFAIICTSTDKKTGKKTTGKLSLVDLAGSERAEKTNVEGLSKAARAAMMEEGIAINESLRMLKSVFRILGEANKPLAKGQKAEIVQYRGNMLTELMQDCLAPSSLVATPTGLVRAGDIAEGSHVLDEYGLPTRVLEVHHGVTSVLFQLQYMLPGELSGSHTVTPNHKVTLRWGHGPVVSTCKKGAALYHQLQVFYFDAASLQSCSHSFRFLLADDAEPLEDTPIPHESAEEDRSLILPRMTEEAAQQLGWAWLEKLGAQVLRAGDLIDVPVHELKTKLAATTQRARETLRLMLVDLPAAAAAPAAASSVDTVELVATKDEVVVTCQGCCDGLPAAVEHTKAEMAAFVARHCGGEGPAASAAAASAALSASAAVVPACPDVVCKQFNTMVRADGQGGVAYTPLQAGENVRVVYMLHHPLTTTVPNDASGNFAYTMNRLEDAWALLGLKAEELGICVSELNPLTGPTNLLDSCDSVYDEVCPHTMTAALLLEPTHLVVFGEYARQRWLEEWESLAVVASGELQYNEKGHPLLHVQLRNGAQVAVFFSRHPSARGSAEAILLAMMAVHKKDIKLTVQQQVQLLQEVAYRSTAVLLQVRQTPHKTKAYPYVSLTVGGSARFTLGDGVLTHNSLGGNAKTLMFVNVGPAASNISESVDSLAYGDLVKNITNEKVSADADNEEQIRFLGAQLRAYEAKFGPLS